MFLSQLMWSFIKGLLLIKDRSIAKELVDDDQNQYNHRRPKTKQFNFRKRSQRRKNML